MTKTPYILTKQYYTSVQKHKTVTFYRDLSFISMAYISKSINSHKLHIYKYSTDYIFDSMIFSQTGE